MVGRVDGTSIGLPFVATVPCITCAVLGLASTVPHPGHDEYLGWARQLTVPLLFLCQRDDGGHPIDNALELFDLFGSEHKTMHLNPGPHVGILGFERGESARFFAPTPARSRTESRSTERAEAIPFGGRYGV